MSGISTTMQNFIQIDLGVSVLRMRDFAPLGILGPISDFSPENGFNIGRLESRRPLIVVVAQ